eukprot:1575234-Pyramimonas_sp.AAC.1
MGSAVFEISGRMWRAMSRGAAWARSSVTSSGPAARPGLHRAACSSSSHTLAKLSMLRIVHLSQMSSVLLFCS